MKYTKILRIFSIAIILSLLMVAVPATPAQAQGSITLAQAEGKIGDEVTITGVDFPPSPTDGSERRVDIYFSSDVAGVGNYIGTHVTTYKKWEASAGIGSVGDNDEGEFKDTFTVPAILNDGTGIDEGVEVGTTYYVYVTLYNSIYIRDVAEFTVTGGEITLALTSGPVGTEVKITGTDFSTNKSITIKYDVDEVVIDDGDTQTDSNGGFTSFILIPDSTAGAHTITVTVSGSEVTADFTVEPEIMLAPTSGEANTTVTVSGTGFGRRQEIAIYFNNVGLATTITDAQGSFATTFNVPEMGAGIYNVDADDADGNTDKAKFTITVPSPPPPPAPSPPPPATTASLSPSGGPIGTQLLIGGAGFKANATVTIKYDDKEITTVNADGSGIFVAAFQVPVSKHGTHTITASDGTSTEKLTFTVESTPPAVPVPLSPEMEAEVKSPISFDWKDVTDDSPPVIYTLQIATSKDFSAASLVLEKKELAKSEYTVTEDEEQKLVGQETPYYWRIRAIDGASNEGEWTGAGEFYIASSFALPIWALYTLIGLGGLSLFALGYWLGRRTAYY